MRTGGWGGGGDALLAFHLSWSLSLGGWETPSSLRAGLRSSSVWQGKRPTHPGHFIVHFMFEGWVFFFDIFSSFVCVRACMRTHVCVCTSSCCYSWYPRDLIHVPQYRMFLRVCLATLTNYSKYKHTHTHTHTHCGNPPWSSGPP